MKTIYLVSFTADTANQNPAPLHNFETLEDARAWCSEQLRHMRAQGRWGGHTLSRAFRRTYFFEGLAMNFFKREEISATHTGTGRKLSFIIEPQELR